MLLICLQSIFLGVCTCCNNSKSQHVSHPLMEENCCHASFLSLTKSRSLLTGETSAVAVEWPMMELDICGLLPWKYISVGVFISSQFAGCNVLCMYVLWQVKFRELMTEWDDKLAYIKGEKDMSCWWKNFYKYKNVWLFFFLNYRAWNCCMNANICQESVTLQPVNVPNIIKTWKFMSKYSQIYIQFPL